MAPVGNPSLFMRFFGLVSILSPCLCSPGMPAGHPVSKHPISISLLVLLRPSDPMHLPGPCLALSNSWPLQWRPLQRVLATLACSRLSEQLVPTAADLLPGCFWRLPSPSFHLTCAVLPADRRLQVENYPLYVMVGIAGGLAIYTPFRHLTKAADIA